MLVLSRKPDEKIMVGDNVTITVLEVRGKTIKLGIEAPGAMRILRGELPNWSDAMSNPKPPRLVSRKSQRAREAAVA